MGNMGRFLSRRGRFLRRKSPLPDQSANSSGEMLSGGAGGTSTSEAAALFGERAGEGWQDGTSRYDAALSDRFSDNMRLFRSIYADCSDVIFHEFRIGGRQDAALIYIEGITNIEELDRSVLAPLLRLDAPGGRFAPSGPAPDAHQDVQPSERQDAQPGSALYALPYIRNNIAVTSIRQVDKVGQAIEEISSGHAVLLVDHEPRALAIGLEKWEQRAIDEPSAESVIRGPREGFVESIRTNTALLRRKIRSPRLKIRSMNIGSYSGTRVAIAYIEGIAEPALVEEAERRLRRIRIDGVLESLYLEELIEDNPYSPFPQLLSTERPDVASSYLLEGHIVILVDGTSNVLVAPITLVSLLQSPEDYYERYMVSTAIRWLRYVFFVLSLLGPSFYIAIITFHQEMIPNSLLLTMARSREQIPFPALVEAWLMETMFEALREAGARLPKQIGTAVSIVGALVIGQAAIAAGIVSAPMVMVVAITGIASFMAPRFTVGISIRLLRFPIMLLAGFLGFLGLIMGVILILTHLFQLRSFGVPYMTPLAPVQTRSLKDVLWRAPRWRMITRPVMPGRLNPVRMSPGLRPGNGHGNAGSGGSGPAGAGQMAGLEGPNGGTGNGSGRTGGGKGGSGA